MGATGAFIPTREARLLGLKRKSMMASLWRRMLSAENDFFFAIHFVYLQFCPPSIFQVARQKTHFTSLLTCELKYTKYEASFAEILG